MNGYSGYEGVRSHTHNVLLFQRCCSVDRSMTSFPSSSSSALGQREPPTGSSSKEGESLAHLKQATGLKCEMTAKHLLEAALGDPNAAVELFYSTMDHSKPKSDPTSLPQRDRQNGISSKPTVPPFTLRRNADDENETVACAFEQARKEKKWMLLHFQSQDDLLSHRLNQDVWSNDVVTSIVEGCFYFWMDVVNDHQNQTKPLEYFVDDFSRQKLKNGKVWKKIVVKDIPSFLIVNPFTRDVRWESTSSSNLSSDSMIENLIRFVDRDPQERSYTTSTSKNSNHVLLLEEEYIVRFRFPNGLVLSSKFPSSRCVKDLYEFAGNTKVSQKQFSEGRQLTLKYIFQCICTLDEMEMTLQEANVNNKVIIVTYR